MAHLQRGTSADRARAQGKLSVEWVGEAREVADGTLEEGPARATKGGLDEFDLMVPVIGFETGNQLS